MLVLIPQKDRRYHRGLGQDTPDLATLLAESNYNQDAPIPSSYPIDVFSPPQIASTISPADIGTPSPTLPGGAMLNAAGVAVPKPGYTLNAQGQIVPASATSQALASLSTFVTQNKNLLLLGGAGILGLSLLSGGKRRRR